MHPARKSCNVFFMRRTLRTMMAAVVFLFTPSGFAHHSFSAEFDQSRPIMVRGVVTGVDWQNPHVFFFVDVEEADGKVVNWAFETMGPNGLARMGWKRDSLMPGDKVIVEAYLAKDGSHLADGRKVMLSNGRSIPSKLPRREPRPPAY
jgi:Family of unknown function (DUF6152)